MVFKDSSSRTVDVLGKRGTFASGLFSMKFLKDSFKISLGDFLGESLWDHSGSWGILSVILLRVFGDFCGEFLSISFRIKIKISAIQRKILWDSPYG